MCWFYEENWPPNNNDLVSCAALRSIEATFQLCQGCHVTMWRSVNGVKSFIFVLYNNFDQNNITFINDKIK